MGAAAVRITPSPYPSRRSPITLCWLKSELPVTVVNGTATGQPDDARTAGAIAEVQKNARAGVNGIALQYRAKTSAAYDGFSITIRRATLDRFIDAKVKYAILDTGIVDLTFDLAALQEIQKQTTGDITLTAAREPGLTGDALAAVGTRPAYRLAAWLYRAGRHGGGYSELRRRTRHRGTGLQTGRQRADRQPVPCI